MSVLDDVDRTRNHWWWRPGWRIGRRFYTWHLTFEGQHALHALVESYQKPLARISSLDLVPQPWLHLTIQGVGFTDEVPSDAINHIAAAVRARLAEVPTRAVTFHRPVILAEAVVLTSAPDEPMHSIRDAIRGGIKEVWGSSRVPDPAVGFRPHVSLAYANEEAPTAPVSSALHKVDPRQPRLTSARFP